jgi:tetratricopeptide (TPR) repeat protein
MNRLGKAWMLGVLVLCGAVACMKEENPAAEHRSAGNKALEKKDWKKSIEEFGKSLQLDPSQAKVWEQKAYAHLQLRESEEVETSLVKAAELYPDQAKKAELYRNLASMYIQNQNATKAETYFLKTIEVNPQDDLAQAWLGEIYAQRGGARTKNPPVPDLLKKSFEYYDRAIAIKPDFANTYINKRIAVNKLKEYETAQKEAAEQALAKEKDPAKKAELTTQIADTQVRIDDLKKQFDELGAKFTELYKASKGAQQKK